MSIFLTNMVNKGYTKKGVLDVLFESEEEKERRRISAIVTKAVDAIRLKNVREFLAYQQQATWRRMNGFDRVANDEKISLVVIVRFHSLQNSILLVCGPRWMR